MKDWSGNSKSTFSTLGASSHSDKDRESLDYYATDPLAVRLLLDLEKFEGEIWECACGEGHLSEEMKRLGYKVVSTDIVNRGYGDGQCDFIGIENSSPIDKHLITNPPYKFANEFIERAMGLLEEGKKLALFLPIRYLEGKERKKLFKAYPPHTVYISSSRIRCAINGDFSNRSAPAVAYAWFVWVKGYAGDTILKWFN